MRQFILTQDVGWHPQLSLQSFGTSAQAVGELAGAYGPVRSEYTNLFLSPSILAELWIPCTGQENFSCRTFLLHFALEFTHF